MSDKLEKLTSFQVREIYNELVSVKFVTNVGGRDLLEKLNAAIDKISELEDRIKSDDSNKDSVMTAQPSEPADSLEQEIRGLLSPFSEHGNHRWDKNEWFETNRGDEMIDALQALIRRREKEAYERGRIAEAKTCEETKQHGYTKVRMEAVEAFAERVKSRQDDYEWAEDTTQFVRAVSIEAIDTELAKWKEGEKG